MFTRVENMTCNLRFEINVVSFKVDLRERVKLFLPKLANVFWGGGPAWHRCCIGASHPAPLGSNPSSAEIFSLLLSLWIVKTLVLIQGISHMKLAAAKA